MFVDRESDLRELRALADRPGPAMALVYGCRRVGKTYLLGHTWPDRRVFYYLTADATAALNRRELVTDLAAELDLSLEPEDYPTWRSVFRLLAGDASAGHIYVSAGGFTPRFRELADEAGDIRLITLEDLYAD